MVSEVIFKVDSTPENLGKFFGDILEYYKKFSNSPAGKKNPLKIDFFDNNSKTYKSIEYLIQKIEEAGKKQVGKKLPPHII